MIGQFGIHFIVVSHLVAHVGKVGFAWTEIAHYRQSLGKGKMGKGHP